MNYIELLNQFYEFIQCSQVSNNAQLLYYTLLAINNKCSWSDWFSRTNVNISGMMGISEKALIRARAELKQIGLIDFIPSKKRGECTKYSILYPTKDSTKGGTNESTNGSTNAVQTTVQSSDINKLKLKQLKKDTNVSKEKRFTAPKVDEVAAYCHARNNGIDAQGFVDFYQSKGWMVGKNKMSDWKAAVRTWEQKRKKGEHAGEDAGRSRKPDTGRTYGSDDYFGDAGTDFQGF